jgi:6-methylsalicylate decarboxylase
MLHSSPKFRLGCPCCPPALGRRAMLVGAAAALGAPTILRAQPADIPALAKRQAIDVHHHFVPPEYLKRAGANLASSLLFPPFAHWTPQATLEQLDGSNIGKALLSISTPGIWFGDNAQARDLARLCNEYAAQLQRDHPGRFGLFAAVSLPDPDAALAETAYALDTLKADGIGLMTSYGDRYLGDQSFWPAFDEFNRRRATVFVHPQNPLCCTQIKDFVDSSFVEFPSDTTRTVLSLMYNGVFAKYPDINWIFCHNGGTFPVLMGRFMALGHAPDAAKRVPPETIPAAARRLYFEAANSANKASVSAVMAVADPTHLLFGSDYPYVPVAATANGLQHVGLSDAELQAIFYDNAVRLMPQLKTA